MNIKRAFATLCAIVIIISLLSLSASADDNSATPEQLSEKMISKVFTDPTGYVLNYRMYASPSYDKTDADRPAVLILYFHDDSGKGSDTSSLVSEKGLLPYLLSNEYDLQYKDFQYIVVAPQCPEGESFATITESGSMAEISPIMSATEKLVAELFATEILFQKILVSGVGSGATAAFDYANRNVNQTDRIFTIGGECNTFLTYRIFDVGVDIFVFSENDNQNIKKLESEIVKQCGISPQIIYCGDTIDQCLAYATNYTEAGTIGDWIIKDTYTSRRFIIKASCNEEGGIIAASPVNASYGAKATVTVTVNAGYSITKVLHNGKEVDSALFSQTKTNLRQYIYTINNITSDQSVTVTLSKLSTSSTHGSLIDRLIVVLGILSLVLIAAAGVVFLISLSSLRKAKRQ